MRVLLMIALIVVGHGAAEAACKAKGKVLFRETTRPLPDLGLPGGHETKLEVFATGAWVYTVDGARTTGCLSKAHRTELERTLKKAKFKVVTGESHCRARTTMEVVHASPKRKKKVTFAAPCSDEPDTWTRNLAACAQLAREDARPSKAQLRERCRGEEETAVVDTKGCKRSGKALYVETVDVGGVPTSILTVYNSGAWTLAENGAIEGGCAPSWHLKLIKKALAKAKFKKTTDESCEVTLTSPKRGKSVTGACDPDTWTSNLRNCAAEAVQDHPKEWVGSICKGQKPKAMAIDGRLY